MVLGGQVVCADPLHAWGPCGAPSFCSRSQLRRWNSCYCLCLCRQVVIYDRVGVKQLPEGKRKVYDFVQASKATDPDPEES